jgi:hypothetical protein
MSKKEKIIGYYNKYGYRIQVIDGDELYVAGNNKYDSTQGAESLEDAIPLDKLKEYCEQSGNEIAKERNAIFVGIEFNGTEEKEIEMISDDIISNRIVDNLLSELGIDVTK